MASNSTSRYLRSILQQGAYPAFDAKPAGILPGPRFVPSPVRSVPQANAPSTRSPCDDLSAAASATEDQTFAAQGGTAESRETARPASERRAEPDEGKASQA